MNLCGGRPAGFEDVASRILRAPFPPGGVPNREPTRRRRGSPGKPEDGVPVSGALRRFLLRRFPYYLLYRVEEDWILVLAVGHHSRRPGYWRDRL